VRAREFSRRALKHALEEAELDPENGRARYLAAGMQLRLGDKERGRRHVDAALRLMPDDFGTLYNAACFYAQANESGRALELLDRAVATGLGFRSWIDPTMTSTASASCPGSARSSLAWTMRAADAGVIARIIVATPRHGCR